MEAEECQDGLGSPIGLFLLSLLAAAVLTGKLFPDSVESVLYPRVNDGCRGYIVIMGSSQVLSLS
jgi:hypothetical protein